MNPFQRHGIGHLSPSSLNLWISQPGIWAWRYLGKARDGGNPKMWRGTAVEAGYAAYLRTGRWEESVDHANLSYATAVSENNARGELADKQAELIEPMIKQCTLWEPPSQLNAAQIEIEHYFDGVPVKVKGYVDLAFEGCDVDLKTTERMPSEPTWAHVRQVSLYRAARQRKGGLLYVTSKRFAYYEVTDEMRDEALAELRDAAVKLSKLLGAFDKPEDVMSVLPVDYSDFRAPPKGAALGSRRPSVTDDFTAVALEN